MADESVQPGGGQQQSFDLSGEPAPVSLEGFAAAHDVTSQSVRNWIGAGMPARKNTRGEWLIDFAAASAWVKENRGERGHGGVRQGSGRPPAEKSGKKKKGRDPAVDEEDEAQEQELLRIAEENRAKAEREAEQKEGDRLADFLKRVPVSHPDFPTLVAREGFSKGIMDRLVRMIDLQKSQVELAIKTRGMAPVAACAERLSSRVMAARAVADGAPLKIAERVVADAKLDQSMVAVLADALRRELALMMRELSSLADGAGAPGVAA